jgi:hypothetical protein
MEVGRMKLSCRKALFAGCLAVLAACEGEPTAIVAEHMELTAARQLWDAQGVDDYRMRVRLMGAWVNAAAVITVRDGAPVSVDPVDQRGMEYVDLFDDYDTVEELFAVLEDAMADAADHIDATYHSDYGLPVEVFIDFRETAVDDEHGFIVETFERL